MLLIFDDFANGFQGTDHSSMVLSRGLNSVKSATRLPSQPVRS
jgi:hypothetical protein